MLALHRKFGFPRRLLGIVCFKHKGLLVRIAVDKPVVATWTCHAGKCWLDRFLLVLTVGDRYTAVDRWEGLLWPSSSHGSLLLL